MVNKQIDDLINIGEGYQLEFKQSLDKSLIREVCAFANASGGKVIIGVADSGKKFFPISSDGMNRAKSQAQDIISKLEPKINVTITHHDGFLLIDIPSGDKKPYYCSEGFFLRIGPNSQKLSRDEIIEMVERSGAIHFDEKIHKSATFDNDFDASAYKNFLQKAKISDTIPPQQVLQNLHCLIDDGRLTNLGVLFFAKTIDFKIRQAICTCVLFKGVDKLHIIDRKDYDTNMLDNIDNAVNFVKRHTNLEYVIKSIEREDVPEIPDIALREAITNAFCHKYYFSDTSKIMVEVYDDRVEVSSFGGLPSGLHHEEFGFKSVQRNPGIADMLVRAHYVEQVGTGIKKIKDSVLLLGKGDVKFTYNENWFTVIFTRNQPHIKKPIAPVVTERIFLNERQREILAIFKTNKELTTIELVKHTGLSESGVRKQLRQLQQLGYIEAIGVTRVRRWILK